MLVEINLAAEAAFVETLRETWLKERAALKQMLDECMASTPKTTPPANYWEAEFKARNRFLTGAKVLATLEGD